MSFERVPPRSEVMGWSPNHLADFLRKMNLSGSDKIVLQSSMNGARFVNMTENDVLKFPKLHAPLISKICSEINKKEERRGLFNKKTTTSKYREPDLPVEDHGWGEDEFDSDDYEDPDVEEDEGSVGDYETPNEEEEDNEDEPDYEPNPSAEDFPQVVHPSFRIGEGDYIDNISRGPPPIVSPRPIAQTNLAPSHQVPSLERRDRSPYREKSPGRNLAAGISIPPVVQRNKKPTREQADNFSPVQEVKFNTLERVSKHPGDAVLPSTHSVRPQERNPKLPVWPKPLVPPSSSVSVARSNSNSIRPPPARFHPEARSETQNPVPASRHHTFPKTLPPRPGLPGLPGLQPRLTDSLPPNDPHGVPRSTMSVSVSRSSSSVGRLQQPTPPPPRPLGVSPHSNAQQHTQDLDPCWYVGNIARRQADHCLKQEHKDGSYLVRDSTKQQLGQPFTLMVLHQQKVYNIQIRLQDNQYQLGTGMNVQETFPTVRAMISHYAQTPLILIDARSHHPCQQNNCFLSHPAGYRLT